MSKSLECEPISTSRLVPEQKIHRAYRGIFRKQARAFTYYSTEVGFTLVELLVVTSIVISLLSLIGPSFKSISRSGALNRDGDLVASLANSARQNSLSNNAMTALIVVIDPSLDSSNRMFAMLELLPANVGQTQAWKQISKWETLNPGIIVSKWTPGTNIPATSFPSLHYGSHTIDPAKFYAMIFMPDGSTYYSNGPTSITLVEGNTQGGTVHYTGRLQNSEPADYYQLTVLNATGRIKIDCP